MVDGKVYIYALVCEGSKGTDDGRKTVRRQEVAMTGVGKEDTLKNLPHF